jgi:uncharacterized protein DUF3987
MPRGTAFFHTTGEKSGLGFRCQHNSCADKKWHDVRALVDGPREERQRRARGKGKGDRAEASADRTAGDFASPECPEPKPLQREIPPSTPFPIDALGDALGEAARKMQDIIQAPMAICGNSLLAAALATQAHGDIVIDGRVFPISEMFVTAGQTGERKSEADKVALRPHREQSGTWPRSTGKTCSTTSVITRLTRRPNRTPWGASRTRATRPRRRTLADLGAAPVRPLEPLLLCEEPTYEGLVKLLAIGQPSTGYSVMKAGVS